MRSAAGQFAEVATLPARVLAVEKQVYGEDDVNTLITANMLANTHRQQGRLTKAE